MRTIFRAAATAAIVAGLGVAHPFAQAKKPKAFTVADLPAPVQNTVRETLKGGVIKRIAKEKEDGIDQFEIETTLNGTNRDFNVAADGRLLVVEEATTLDAIPAAAKAAIQKRVGAGKVTAVETVAKPGQPLLYEAAFKDAKGKGHEVLVDADGHEVKD